MRTKWQVKFLTLMLLLLSAPLAIAQEGMGQMERMKGICPMCGGGGVTFMILGGIFLLAATAALIALAVFLVRRSRVQR